MTCGRLPDEAARERSGMLESPRTFRTTRRETNPAGAKRNKKNSCTAAPLCPYIYWSRRKQSAQRGVSLHDAWADRGHRHKTMIIAARRDMLTTKIVHSSSSVVSFESVEVVPRGARYAPRPVHSSVGGHQGSPLTSTLSEHLMVTTRIKDLHVPSLRNDGADCLSGEKQKRT